MVLLPKVVIVALLLFLPINAQVDYKLSGDEINPSGSILSEEPPDLLLPLAPRLRLAQGSLIGTYETSRSGQIFASFKGIPYGKVVQRFSPPIPAPPWKEETLNATSFGPRCPQLQKGLSGVGQSEDCLFLNVFVPKMFPLHSDVSNVSSRARNQPLPVMLLFETGGFQFGGGDRSGPNYFMDEPVILVTFNYRMNIFGFLSTNSAILPGNNGLKDQTLALAWVQRNIAPFGGDPWAITIFGESAGGTSVSYHLLLPKSRGLFRSAIAQSGSSLIWRHFTPNLVSASDAFATRVGCPTSQTSSRAMVTCLRGKGVDQLLKALQPDGNVLEVPAQIFVPTLEPGFLPESPINLLRSARFARVPLLLTITKDEGLLRNSAVVIKSPQLLHQLNKDWYSVAPVAFGNYAKFPLSPSTRTFISTKIREFYFPDGQEITADPDSFANLTALYSDSGVMSGVKQLALWHAKRAPVYAAVFAYEGVWSEILALGYKQPLGIAHSDDLQYLFHNEIYPTFPPGSRLENVSKRFVKSWVHFARTGVPADLEPNSSESWRRLGRQEHQTGHINWLYLQDHPRRHAQPLGRRLKFWDFINMIIEFDLKYKF